MDGKRLFFDLQLAMRLVALAVATAVAAGCSVVQSEESEIGRANALYHAGKAENAITALQSVLQRDGFDPGARYLLGFIYLQTRQLAEAEQTFVALDGLENGPNVTALLARTRLLLEKYDAVLEATASSLDTMPGPELAALRGHALFRKGQFEEAGDLYQRILAKWPDSAEARLGLARIALWQSQLLVGRSHVERALELDPRLFEAWQTRGDIEQALGHPDAAIEAYRQALGIVPTSAPVLINLAWIQIGTARYDRASETIRLLRKAAPQSLTGEYMDALLEYRRGELQRARMHAVQVLRGNPSHIESIYIAGASSFRLGEYGPAADFLNTAVTLAPHNLHYRALLVFACARSNRILEGRKALEPVLQSKVDDRNTWAAAGELYLRMRQPTQAIEAFNRALRHTPDNSELLAFRGIAKIDLGQIERGVSDLEASVQSGTQSSTARSKLVFGYLRTSQFEQAEKIIDEVAHEHPNEAIVYRLRAAALLAQGRRDDALVLLEKGFRNRDADPTLGVSMAKIEQEAFGPAAAKSRLVDVLRRDSANVAALLGLARIAEDAGSEVEKLRWLEQARQKNPDRAEPRVELAKHYLLRNEPGKAVGYLREAAALTPDDAQLLDLLGRAYLARGDASAAVAAFGRLVAVRPDSAAAYYQLGVAQAKDLNRPAARLALNEALRIDPKHTSARFTLGQIEIASKRYAEALVLAGQLESLPEGLNEALILAGDAFLAQERFAEAAQRYQRAYALAKSHVAAAKAHAALRRVGRAEEGEALLRDWLKHRPDDLATRLYLAGAYLAREAYPLAIKEYEFHLSRQPDNALVLNNLAFAYHQASDARAEATAQRALELAPESAAVLDTLGIILIRSGRVDRAAQLLEKATDIAPEAPEIRYHYALALIKIGALEQALEALDRVARNPQPFASRLQALSLQKELEQRAKAAKEKAERLQAEPQRSL